MTLKVLDVMVAEGSEKECVMFAAMFLDVLKQEHKREQQEEARKEMELMEAFTNIAIEELMRAETDDGKKGDQQE